MKKYFTFTLNKTSRFLLLLLILLIAMPIIDTQHIDAQTTNTGNFFTRRFKRKNKFQRKSKNRTAFRRKPFKCSEVGKQKVKQIKVSKKQLRRWEEERLVKAEQEELKEARKTAKSRIVDNKNMILSASSNNDIEEVSNQEKEVSESKTKEKQKEEETKLAGWYSSEQPDAPKVSPIIIDQNSTIASQKNKEELEVAAKHSRLGYTIVLEGNNKKELEIVEKYLLSIGAEQKSIKITLSEPITKNKIGVKIEK